MNEDVCALCNEPVEIVEGSVAAPVYEGKLLSPEQEFQMGDELVCMPVHDKCLKIAQLEGALQRTYKLINHWSAEATREHQTAADLFGVITDIAKLVGIERSEPEISHKTVAAVRELKSELEEAQYELEKERLFVALDKAEYGSEEANSLLEQTMAFDEHPEWYEDACGCQLCCSYGD